MRLVLLTLVLGSLAMGQTVVFVCEHGAAKSIIAVAEFNKLAEQKGLPQRAISRGTNLDAEFAPGVVAGLKKDGLPVPDGKPALLTQKDVAKAERVVTLGCKLPEPLAASAKPVDWSDISSPSKNYDSARDDISRHVQQLIEELTREKSKK